MTIRSIRLRARTSTPVVLSEGGVEVYCYFTRSKGRKTARAEAIINRRSYGSCKRNVS